MGQFRSLDPNTTQKRFSCLISKNSKTTLGQSGFRKRRSKWSNQSYVTNNTSMINTANILLIKQKMRQLTSMMWQVCMFHFGVSLETLVDIFCNYCRSTLQRDFPNLERDLFRENPICKVGNTCQNMFQTYSVIYFLPHFF